jgi:hypothetical protein
MPRTGAEHHGEAGKSSGHTPGAVKDPEHDGRLKENRDQGVHVSDKSRETKSRQPGGHGHTPGAVKDPNDGRLKENREKGVHKGDA